MWPALILAANRKDKVMGRTPVLTVSIITRNGFNQSGAPAGKKCAAKEDGALITAEKISDNHKGKPNESVIIRWLEELKTYGRSPMRFVVIKSMNNGVTIEANPLMWVPNVREDWSCIILIGVYDAHVNWFGLIQKDACSNISIAPVIIQNRDEESENIILVCGSNDEKISVIIKV